MHLKFLYHVRFKRKLQSDICIAMLSVTKATHYAIEAQAAQYQKTGHKIFCEISKCLHAEHEHVFEMSA